MEVIVERRHRDVRRLAYSIIDKLKSAAAELESDNPHHKNGVKYFISKKKYDSIIEIELKKKNVSDAKRVIVIEFINDKLKETK
jgi:hypothetical protein